MTLKELLLERTRKYLAAHPDISTGQAMDHVLASEANLGSFSQEETDEIGKEARKGQIAQRAKDRAAAGEELDRAVLAYQASNPKADYSTAQDAVLAVNPELKRRYAGSY